MRNPCNRWRCARTAWYLATALEPEGLRDILRQAATDAGATSLGPENGDIEVVRRAASDRSYLFIINHGTTAIEHPCNGFDLVTQQSVQSTVTVPAGAVRVIREDKTV